MSLIGGLFSTAIVAVSLVGKNFAVSEDYKRNANELSMCLKSKGIDPAKYGDHALANIELLTLAKAQTLDKETKFRVENSRILTDFDENPFVLVELNQGFSVYSVINHVFAEITVFGKNNPFGEYIHSKKKLKYVWLNDYYVEEGTKVFSGLRGKTTIDDNKDIENLKELSYTINKEFDLIHDYRNEEYVLTNTEHFEYTTAYDDGSRCGGRITSNNPYGHRQDYSVTIPYSWYFKKNKDGFPHNRYGTCGYVALSMLLGYNEFFGCAGYFNDEQSASYITPAVSDNFGETVPKISEKFQYDMLGAKTEASASASWLIKDAAESFLNGKQIRYSHYDWLWLFGSVLEPINHGSPAILFGWNFPRDGSKDGKWSTGCHAIVVYEYHQYWFTAQEVNVVTELTCHYGWEGDGYQEMIIPAPSFVEQGSVYSLYNESEHVCKGYFLNSQGTIVRCGCGKILKS